jgi:hypothetical protein
MFIGCFPCGKQDHKIQRCEQMPTTLEIQPLLVPQPYSSSSPSSSVNESVPGSSELSLRDLDLELLLPSLLRDLQQRCDFLALARRDRDLLCLSLAQLVRAQLEPGRVLVIRCGRVGGAEREDGRGADEDGDADERKDERE